jgi:tRNA G37 N-methylase TrmD
MARGQYDFLLGVDAFGEQVQAKFQESGQLEVQYTEFVPVFETVTKTQTVSQEVIVDGKKRVETKTVEVPVTVCKCVPETRTQLMTTEGLEVYDMAGKQVDAAQLRKLLKEEKTVLLAGRKIPRYFTSIYKPDTLLLVMTHSGPFGIAPAAEAPVPAPPAPDAPLPPAPGAPLPPDPAADGPVAPAIAMPAMFGGPHPLVGLAKQSGETIAIRRYVKDISKETATRQVTEGKETKEVSVQIEVESLIDVERKYPATALEIYRADGKAVKAADVKTLLAKDTAVLVSGDGKKVPERWLKILKPETLVVVAPQPQTPVMAAPAKAPALEAPAIILPAPAPAPPVPQNSRVPLPLKKPEKPAEPK